MIPFIVVGVVAILIIGVAKYGRYKAREECRQKGHLWGFYGGYEAVQPLQTRAWCERCGYRAGD